MEVPARKRMGIRFEERSEGTTRPSPSSSVPLVDRINFVFEWKKITYDRVAPECRDSLADFVIEKLGPLSQDHDHLVMDQIGTNFLMERKRESRCKVIPVINHSQVLDSTTTRETIKRKLSNWDVTDSCRERFIKNVVRKTRDKVKSMSSEYNFLIVHAKLDIKQDRFCSLPDVANWMMTLIQSIDRGMVIRSRRVSATDSSIEALEKKTMMNCESCSICLDEFDVGCQAPCMPCSHVFHVNCITEWLRRKPSCPMCRFEMPMN